MLTVAALSLALTAAPSMTAALADLFECRSANPVSPSLPVVRSEDDRRAKRQFWTYEARGQRVFGLAPEYLSHAREHNGDSGLYEFNYTVVINGDLNLARWLFERSNPDMRCSRNGAGYTCLVASQMGTSGGEFHKVRSASIFRTAEDEAFDYATGTVISCSWTEDPAR